MKKRFIIFTIVILSILFLSFSWWRQAIKPMNPTNTEPVIFVVNKGEGVRSIADRLQKQELIRSSVAMFLYIRWKGIDDSIQAGDFRLNPSMSIPEIADALTHGTIDVWVTIPEGWRNEEIALRLSKELAIPESEFLKSAQEGYMFPDTYLLPKEASAGGVIEIFLANFRKKVSDQEITLAQQKGLSLERLVIIASLVEREARLDEDRPIIASVILNRLALPMKLDIDATIQYALGYQTDEKTWWKKHLTLDDLALDSPYNTYTNPGLPPGPISNPGMEAVKAVLEAPATDYLYYVADSQGKSHFARTLEEHQQNVGKYIQ